MKKQLLFLLLCGIISKNSQAQSISFTSALPSSIAVGTNLTVDYKYTIASPGYIYCGLELLGANNNEWSWISTVGGAQLDPAPAGTDRTGTFTIFIPANTAVTSSLTGAQNYKIKIELKNAAYQWITGDYPATKLNLTSNLSVDNNILDDKLSVYPNPVVDVLNIDTLKNLTNASFSIISSSGQSVVNSKSLNTNNSVDVSGLSSGIYFLSIVSDEEKKQYKFIKQ
jgi:hypothetical protein